MFEHIHDPAARVRALCEYGGQVEIDASIPPRRYFKSGNEMIRMANVYVEEKKLEQAFILYTKFITLFVEKLPKHPEYKNATSKEKTVNRHKLKEIFPNAEALKKKLKEKYEIIEAQRQNDLEREKQEELEREREEQRIREELRATEIAKEIDNKEQMRQQYGEKMLQEQEEQYKHLQEIERQKIKDKENQKLSELSDNVAGASISRDSEDVTLPPPPAYGSVIQDGNDAFKTVPSVPRRDLKPSAPPVTSVQVPLIDRSNKPHHFTSVGDTSNPYGLHGVQVPQELIVKFLNIAMSNTLNNLETGGFLFGKLANDEFHVTHLIVPHQTGSADSFTDLSKEDDLWELQDKYDIVQLGWIHTHPSQTAFLSSVDQHVQASFQCMLPESIAIVCAPKHDETGIFYLTPDYGLNFIRNCKEKEFHPHPSTPAIFESCRHATLNANGKVTVIDLRI